MEVKKEFQLGKTTLDTRIVMPPMAINAATEFDGRVTQQMLDYYEQRSANENVGMIITEHCYITKEGKARERQLSIADDFVLDGLQSLTEVIHRHGTKAIAQLNHAGSAAVWQVTGMEAAAPSAVMLPVTPPLGNDMLPRELSKDRIEELIQAYVLAALRAKDAGYDGVEIHSAHGYLLNQFYSPLTNKRKDEYGGSLGFRLTIHRKVIRAVRDAIGEDMLLSVRLGGCDYMEGGNTIQDCVDACKMLAKEKIDLISLSGGMCRYTREGHTEPGYFQDMALAVKEAVQVPVLLTGGVKTLEEAEELVQKGACDLVGVGRALLKDAGWTGEA